MSTTTADVDAYAAQVRAALADLPAADRDDLLADLEDHLTEVAAEGELTELLGAPAAYAAELRSSAGLPPPSAAGDRPARVRPAWLTATLDFLPELRPGWWVLRGLLIGGVVGLLLSGSVPLAVLLGLLAVPFSVLLGRRSEREPGLRWVGIAATAAAAVLLVLVLGLSVGSGSSPAQESWPAYQDGPGLSGVTNLYPYSSDGKPLEGVQLFDQDGQPVELTAESDGNGYTLSRVPRRTTDGSATDNAYPQQQNVADVNGPGGLDMQDRPVPPPVVRAPVLAPR